MTIHTNIQGLFNLISPMTVATTEVWGLDDNNGTSSARPVSRKTDKPLTATMRQQVMVDGRRYTIPFFPSNDIRGRIRRKAAALVMESLKARGITIPIEVYSGLTCGAATASPENNLSIEEAVRAARHVYMGLLGGGTRILKSRLVTNDLVPVMETTIRSGMVPPGFGRYAHEDLPSTIEDVTTGGGEGTKQVVPLRDGMKLTDVRHIVRVDDVNRVLRAEEMQQYITDCNSAVAAKQAAAMLNSAQRKEDKKAGSREITTKNTVSNIVSVEGMIPGVDLYARFDMADTLTDAQIGLLLCSLQMLVNEQGLGGYARMGYGKFRPTDFVLTHEGNETPVFVDSPDGSYLLAPSLDRYVIAMRTELAAETLESISMFFLPTKEPEAKAKTKSAKAEKTAEGA